MCLLVNPPGFARLYALRKGSLETQIRPIRGYKVLKPLRNRRSKHHGKMVTFFRETLWNMDNVNHAEGTPASVGDLRVRGGAIHLFTTKKAADAFARDPKNKDEGARVVSVWYLPCDIHAFGWFDSWGEEGDKVNSVAVRRTFPTKAAAIG